MKNVKIILEFDIEDDNDKILKIYEQVDKIPNLKRFDVDITRIKNEKENEDEKN